MRNLGTAFSYQLQAIKALKKGLGRVSVNEELLGSELEEHYELLAEAVQTVMRKHDIENPYEKLKELTRGRAVTQKDFEQFIGQLDLPKEEKETLKKLTPREYSGYAAALAKAVKKYL